MIGFAVTTVSFIVLAVADQSWEIYVASGILGVGIGFAFAALANLIVEAVRPDQTGVATGMNTIVRTIGGALGAELAVSILAANVVTATGYPSKHGYTVTFAIGAAVVAVAVFASPSSRAEADPSARRRLGRGSSGRRRSPNRDRGKTASARAPTRQGRVASLRPRGRY